MQTNKQASKQTEKKTDKQTNSKQTTSSEQVTSSNLVNVSVPGELENSNEATLELQSIGFMVIYALL